MAAPPIAAWGPSPGAAVAGIANSNPVPKLRPVSSTSAPALRRSLSGPSSNRPYSSPAVRKRASVTEGVGVAQVVPSRGSCLPFGAEAERPRPASASGLPAPGSRPASRSGLASASGTASHGPRAASPEDEHFVPEEDRETHWGPKEIFHLHFIRRNLHYRELMTVRERLMRSPYNQEIESKFKNEKLAGTSLGRFGQIMREVDEACGDFFTQPGNVTQFYDINCLPGGCASYILSKAQNYVKGVGVCMEKGWELRFNQQWHFQLMKEVHLNNGIPHHFQVRHEDVSKDPLACLFQKDRSTRLTNVVDLVTGFACYHVHSVRQKRNLLIAQTIAGLRNLRDGGSLVLLLDVAPRVWSAGLLCLLRRTFRDVMFVKPKAAPHADRGLFCVIGRAFDLYTAAKFQVAQRLAQFLMRYAHAVQADETEFLAICSVDGATGGSISLQGGDHLFSPERFVDINVGFLLKIYEPVWRSFKSYAESFLQAEHRMQRARALQAASGSKPGSAASPKPGSATSPKPGSAGGKPGSAGFRPAKPGSAGPSGPRLGSAHLPSAAGRPVTAPQPPSASESAPSASSAVASLATSTAPSGTSTPPSTRSSFSSSSRAEGSVSRQLWTGN